MHTRFKRQFKNRRDFRRSENMFMEKAIRLYPQTMICLLIFLSAPLLIKPLAKSRIYDKLTHFC